MARAADALVAEIARRAGRATPTDIDDALAFLADQRRSSRTLSLAQVLIKRKKIHAEEFLDLTRRLEAPLFRCPACGHEQSAKQVDDSAGADLDMCEGATCVACREKLDLGALAQALPPEAISLAPRSGVRDAGPLARLSSGAVPTVPQAAVATPLPGEALPAAAAHTPAPRAASEAMTRPSRASVDPDGFGYESDSRLPPLVSEEHPGALDADEVVGSEEETVDFRSAADDEDTLPYTDADRSRTGEGPGGGSSASRDGLPGEGSRRDRTHTPLADSTDGPSLTASEEAALEQGLPPPGRSSADDDSDEVILPASASGEAPAPRIPDSGEIDRAIARGVSLGASQRAAREAEDRAVAEASASKKGAMTSSGQRRAAGASGVRSTSGSGTGGETIGRAILAGGDGAAGKRFAGFEVISTLGVGGMGVVYKARQIALDRVVALKVLREGEGARGEQVERFQREARAAAKLAHPNIVAIHEVGLHEGIHFFTMDLVEGETLHDKLRRGDRPPPAKAAAMLAVVARAVHYAHERGIIHRDLKPGNVMINRDGVPMITDFGLAKQLGADDLLTQSGAAIGTPLYMSPEQVKGDLKRIDARSDVFSLGTLLYQLLTGALPFTADWHVELYNRILAADPEPPRKRDPKVPKDLETICLRALEKKPEDRYQSALAMAQDLEKAQKGEQIDAKPASSTAKVLRAGKRYRTALVAIASAAVVAGAGVWMTLGLVEKTRLEGEAQAREKAQAEARALSSEAALAARDGRWKEALERAALLHARFPESDESRETRLVEAEADLRTGRPGDALRALAKSYRRARDEAEKGKALLGIAAAYAAEDDRAHALLALAKVGERAPGTRAAAQADLLAGRLLAETDDREAARARLQAALAASGASALEKDERQEAQAVTAWLDALGEPLPLAGARAGAIGDVTGDGRPELLLARGAEVTATELGPEGPVVVARGRALGGRAGVEVIDLVAADVDADGRADAVVVARTPEEGAVLAVLGRAKDGRFAPLYEGRLEGRVARGCLAAGDLDGDGRADVVVATAPTPAPAAGAAGASAGPQAPAPAPGGLRALRSSPDGNLAPVAVVDEPGAQGTAVLSLLVADLDKDGKAEVVAGTGGGAGDDVRVYRWAASGGLDVAWRRKTGPVIALAADDVDGDGAKDLLVGRASGPLGGARAGDASFLAEGLYLFRPSAEAGKAWEVAWQDPEPAGAGTGTQGARIGPLCPLPGLEAARVRGLASGDLFARGAALAIALAEPAAEGEAPPRAVIAYAFGRGGAIERRRIAFAEGPAGWVRAADLDADGDAELVVGNTAGVRIYGMKGRR